MRLEPTVIRESLENMRGKRVLVMGDVILDRYESGDVARLSREAPVPVLMKAQKRDVPGGAANAAVNVRALGGVPRLVGVTGTDDEASILQGLLIRADVPFDLFGSGKRSTTLKTRFLHGSQQLLRVDRERVEPLDSDTVAKVQKTYTKRVQEADCVLLSDYAKGFFSPELHGFILKIARERDVPLIVDPKPVNSYLCKGSRLFVPNRGEGALIAGMAGGDASGEMIAGILGEKFKTSVILTDGENGMFVSVPGREIVHIESRAVEVYDVSGAGDTVAAAVSLAVVAGSDVVKAAALANEAAGVAVSKLGTAAVLPWEILERAGASHRILDWEHLKAEVGRLRSAGRKVVFTNGCFDLLHVGHIRYLKEARTLGDALVVGINTDSSVRRIKGPGRPLISEQQRAELIAALESVDYVTLFDQDTPVELIERLRPDIFAKGGDYTEEMLPEAPVVRANGGEVRILPLFGNGISTSNIIERISGKRDA